MSDQFLDYFFGAFKNTVDGVSSSGKASAEFAKNVLCKTRSFYDRSIRTFSQEELSFGADSVSGNSNGILESFGSFVCSRKKLLIVGLGVSSTGALLYAAGQYLLPVLPKHLENDNNVLLVLGDIRDPVVRNQVNEFYRRRFIIFVCNRKLNYGTGEPDDDFTIDDLTSEDGGIFFIEADATGLSSFIGFMNDNPEKQLRSILFMPNLSYYSSGAMLSYKMVQNEVQENVLKYYSVLEKILPHFAGNAFKKLQLIFYNPSLSRNLKLKHHPSEFLVSGLISALYEAVKVEYSHQCEVYMCNVGIVGIGGNASTYKYLSVRGSNITKSLCEPIYQLIISRDYLWFRLKRWIGGNILYCGKGSSLTSWLGPWCPLWVLDMF